MKNLLLYLITIVTLSSCATSAGLTGRYQDRPYEVTSGSDYQTTWNKVIDLFSAEGYPIQVLEKASGLIVTQRMDFTSATTIENKGRPKLSSAYFVSEAFSNIYGKHRPTDVQGQWNVRVKEVGDKVLVAINIVNIRGEYIGAQTTYGQAREQLQVKSTGVFEKKIAAIIAGPSIEKSTHDKAIIAEAPAQYKSTQEVEQPISEKPALEQSAPETPVAAKVSEDDSKSENVKNQEIELDEKAKDLEFEKKNFEILRQSILSELDERGATIERKESELDAKEVALNLRESELNVKERNLTEKAASLNSKAVSSSITATTAPATSTPSQVIEVPQAQKVVSPPPVSNPLPDRYIQFTATGAGKTFSNVSYLGQVVSEKVPGKNIYRYKVKGQFTDSDVNWVIGELEKLGYKGAFEN